jgi:hypothetical protein
MPEMSSWTIAPSRTRGPTSLQPSARNPGPAQPSGNGDCTDDVPRIAIDGEKGKGMNASLNDVLPLVQPLVARRHLRQLVPATMESPVRLTMLRRKRCAAARMARRACGPRLPAAGSLSPSIPAIGSNPAPASSGADGSNPGNP